MLASTVQFSRNGPRQPPGTPAQGETGSRPAEETRPRRAPVPSGPNSVPARPQPPGPPFRAPPANGKTRTSRARETGNQVNSQRSTRRHGRPREHPPRAAPALLRKEVTQPHLPVRLPCYDFVPIADPTFDSSLPIRG